MLDENSRYADSETATLPGADGREVPYKRRRFLPRPEDMPTPGPPGAAATVTVAEGDRVDLLSARAVGDPLLFYRICDLNGAMHPDEITAEVGRVLQVPTPGLGA